jgi:hypothetical protein
LPIVNWPLGIEAIGNRKSTIGNHETHPLPRGGTDLIAFEPSLFSKTLLEHYPTAN